MVEDIPMLVIVQCHCHGLREGGWMVTGFSDVSFAPAGSQMSGLVCAGADGHRQLNPQRIPEAKVQ